MDRKYLFSITPTLTSEPNKTILIQNRNNLRNTKLMFIEDYEEYAFQKYIKYLAQLNL